MAEKIEVARALAALGVDVIEAGFPIASAGDFEAVRAIAGGSDRVIRLRTGPLQRPRHRSRLGGHPVRSETADSRFSGHLGHPPRAQAANDQGPDHREGRCGRAPGQGDAAPISSSAPKTQPAPRSTSSATSSRPRSKPAPPPSTFPTPSATPRRCNTPRSSAPSRSACPISSGPVISTHCHDDLGLAVANSLAGCEAGARQVECTINGIGERAGNAALEEVVMALKTRFDYYGLTTGIKTERLYPISRMLSAVTGHGRSAQQGNRRPKRVRPRVRNPSRRNAQGAINLRDHAPRRRRRSPDRPRAGQTFRPARAARSGRGDGLHA